MYGSMGVCIYVQYVCTCVCMYVVCMYVCMYINQSIHTWVDHCSVHIGCEGAEYSALEVCAAGGHQLAVPRVEGAAEHGALELLLDHLAYPPFNNYNTNNIV